jgi:hypothetical protein
MQDLKFSQWYCWQCKFLACDILSLGEWFLVFCRIPIRNNFVWGSLKHQYTSTRPHSTMFQKTVRWERYRLFKSSEMWCCQATLNQRHSTTSKRTESSMKLMWEPQNLHLKISLVSLQLYIKSDFAKSYHTTIYEREVLRQLNKKFKFWINRTIFNFWYSS